MSIFAFSPVRKESRSQIPMNKMHTSTTDWFRWDVNFCMPLVAKDVVSLNIQTFVDSAPNPFPINGSASYGSYAFFVPFRIVWKDWLNYIGHLQNNLTPPYFTIGDLVDAFYSSSNPWKDDYFDAALKYISNIDNLASIVGFVTEYSSSSQVPERWRNFKLHAMPLRMVNRIWFDWMRDKVHISDSALDAYCKDTGGHITISELIQLCAPKYRCYPKNYVTTCFDEPQDGAQGNALGNIPSTSENPGFGTTSSNANVIVNSSSTAVGKNVNNGNSVISSTPANQLRLADAKQNLAERLLLAGKTRLSRALALFNTSPTIEELHMSNYLGGHEEDLLFKTSMVGASTAIGSDSGISVGAFGYNPTKATLAGQKFQSINCNPDGVRLKDITYKTDESGYIFVISCVTPHVQYYQGLPRNWTRGLETLNSDVTDFFHSDFENQPLQAVMNYEVCARPDINPKRTFGFNLMYSDYKQLYDSLGGDFIAPISSELMKNMHLGRDIHSLLETLATAAGETDLNSFLTPSNLVQATGYDVEEYDSKFSITNSVSDHFVVNNKISVLANRPMEKYCLPSLDSSLSQLTPKNMIETGGLRL